MALNYGPLVRVKVVHDSVVRNATDFPRFCWPLRVGLGAPLCPEGTYKLGEGAVGALGHAVHEGLHLFLPNPSVVKHRSPVKGMVEARLRLDVIHIATLK